MRTWRNKGASGFGALLLVELATRFEHRRERPMSARGAAADDDRQRGFLGWIERVGNKVPHPAIIFLASSSA